MATASSETMSFTDAFVSKYSELIDENVTTPQVMSFQEGKDRLVEFVGVDKVAQRISRNLREVSLRGFRIDRAGQFTDEIKQQMKQVTSLDISNNSFECWLPIADIVACLPSLSNLIVSDNPQLQFPSDLPLKEVLEFKDFFKNVKSIVFGNSEQSWFGITYCALQMWSREIESLEVFRNGMTELTTPPPNCFFQLKHLSLSGNPITEWSEICKLGILPNLKELLLSDCQISSIFFEADVERKTNLFQSLEQLSLAGNQLKIWRDIAELNKLKSLKDLNVKNNPVTAVNCMEDYEAIVNLVIARVSGLTKVNHEEISDGIEKEAAKYYVKKYYLDYHNSENHEWHLNHPRWSELIEMVGEPVEHMERIKSKHVSLVFKHEDGNSKKKKLPESTTVSSVKTMVKKMFGLNDDCDVKLIWKTNKDEEFEYTLEEDEHPLSYYSVDDDDVIHVTQ